jgi:hypothetical protein
MSTEKKPLSDTPGAPVQFFTFKGPAFDCCDMFPDRAPTSPYVTHQDFFLYVLSSKRSKLLWNLFKKAKNGTYPAWSEITDAARSLGVPAHCLSARLDEEFRAAGGVTVKAAAASVAGGAYGLTPAEASAALEAARRKKRKRTDEPMYPLLRKMRSIESSN